MIPARSTLIGATIAVLVVFGAASVAAARVEHARDAKSSPFSAAPPDSDIWVRGPTSVARFDHATGAFEGLVKVPSVDFISDVHVDPHALWVLGRHDARDGSASFDLLQFAGATGKRTVYKMTSPEGSPKVTSSGYSPDLLASTRSAVVASWSTGSSFALIDLLSGKAIENGQTAYQDGDQIVVERQTSTEPFVEWGVLDESGTVRPLLSGPSVAAAMNAAVPERTPTFYGKVVHDGVLYGIAKAAIGRAYAHALVRAPISGGPVTAQRLPDSTKPELEELSAGNSGVLLREAQDGRLRLLDAASLSERAILDKICSLAADLPCGVSTPGQSQTSAITLAGVSSAIPRASEIWVLRGDGGLLQLDPSTLHSKLEIAKTFRDQALADKLRPGTRPK